MKPNWKSLENDLRNYIQSDRDYDGSVSAANGRTRCLQTLYGSIPYGIKTERFVDMLLMRPTWNVEDSVKWCLAWCQREYERRPVAPKIF